MLPPLPPLRCSHENLVTFGYRNLHGENRVQFLFVGDPRLLGPSLCKFHSRHQVCDQCARIHSCDLKMDSYHGTRKSSFQLSAVSSLLLSFPPQRIFCPHSVEPESCRPGTP